ncbi:SRPBCC domain-containing protein [Actinopolymorpha pittospori]|uniref:Uncharacterized protein YndB with AHSA1/START domain n=1 Tax=Actinopolymorpha pittospori TaxID=648752 RepID=A0A927RB91_9ACTN|nr:SRPBCC domain-containing protein [Actinopolymorpha pittospori]MBE1609887.1 uncharacterized protein YndB with AHSA1/START domain [Actinopolymorpha pittospori]
MLRPAAGAARLRLDSTSVPDSNRATGEQTPTAGSYREVVEPERLVWAWQSSEPLPEESVVTITLTDLAENKTRMHFTQVGFTWGVFEYGIANTRAGFSEEIDKLAKYLANI